MWMANVCLCGFIAISVERSEKNTLVCALLIFSDDCVSVCAQNTRSHAHI